jgi:hypothetical protein
MAGSSHTLTSHTRPALSTIGVILTAFVGDDGTGAVPNLAVSFPSDCELLELITNPGSTAPAANYDITAVDADSIDRFQSCGLNRHTTASEAVAIIFATNFQKPVVRADEALTITIANQTNASATGTIAIVYRVLDRRA